MNMNDWQMFKHIYDSRVYRDALDKAFENSKGYQNFPHKHMVEDNRIYKKLNKLKAKQVRR